MFQYLKRFFLGGNSRLKPIKTRTLDRKTELLEKIELWCSPIGPFISFDEFCDQKSLWIDCLEVNDLQILSELLLMPHEELSALGIANIEDFQFETSSIFGQVGKKFPEQAIALLHELITVAALRICVFHAIDEMKNEQCFPILAQAKILPLDQEELLAFISAIGSTPSAPSLALLQKLQTRTDLSAAIKEELEIAFRNKQLYKK